MSRQTPKAALAVVDMQEDFCKPHGSLGIEGARELALVINELLSSPEFAFKFATQDFHPSNHVSFASQHKDAVAGTTSHIMVNPENNEETQTIILWPDHCAQATKGVEIIPEIDQTKLSRIIQKGWDSRLESFSGFGPPFRNPTVSMTQLNEILQGEGITHLFVVGVGFDGCVKCTALDGVEFGYKTYIIQDGTNAAARSEQMRSKSLSELKDRGVRLISQPEALEILRSL